MTLVYIVLGTLVAGMGSVLLAALIARALLARYTQHLLSLAAGALLATAFMHLLPEAFESGAHIHALFATLLGGVLMFFFLDKAELWHHGHEHHQTGDQATDPHQISHAHGHHGHSHASGSWSVLLGDSVHAFGDGILVAAAFMANLHLGLAASVAVLAHEVPHHIGDLVVLRQQPRARGALFKLMLAGGTTVVGGLLGYWLVEGQPQFLPYLLTIASGSYIYVALADLIPQLQKRLSSTATLHQVAWLLAGIGAVTLVSAIGLHAH
ncbi:MAG: ZIP family metal transporter [Alphaproteobacteria bacterium]|nr:ZIP family metal transporter [Alphaproteobacteria bacterium]